MEVVEAQGWRSSLLPRLHMSSKKKAKNAFCQTVQVEVFKCTLWAERCQRLFTSTTNLMIFNRKQPYQQKQVLSNQQVNRYLMDLRSLQKGSILFLSRWHLFLSGRNCSWFDCSIVAVHGLNGHRENTWTMNGRNWLRDFLPKNIPNARIYSWGYDANTHTTHISSQYLYGHATTLISDLCRKRKMTKVLISAS